MARDFGIIPAWVSSDKRFVVAGREAALLWCFGRAQVDGYGRMLADPFRLRADALTAWGLLGGLTDAEAEAARDALVQVGLWHMYQVNGIAYIEYEGYDDDQDSAYLAKRGMKSKCPDPPNRPDLWVCNRPHYGKRPAAALVPAPVHVEPAALPPVALEQIAVAAAQIPQPKTPEQDAAPADDTPLVPWERSRASLEFDQVCRDNGLESWTRFDARMMLVSAVAGISGRSPDILVEVAHEAARKASGTKPPGPTYARTIINNLPSNVLTREQAREHFEGSTNSRAAPPENGGPGGDGEDPRERIRRQREAAGVAHATA